MRYQISKLVKDGLYKEAITLYSQNHSCSIKPTNHTFPYLLKACSQFNSIPVSETIHAHLFKTGYQFSKHTMTDLCNMYMKMGEVDSAVKLFDEIPHPDTSVLNVMISGFCRNGFFSDGFAVFKEFSVRNWRVDRYTVVSAVSACESLVSGVQVHCLGVKIGVECEEYVGTALVTMYLKFGELERATRLFGFIGRKTLVLYNAYVSGMVHNGVVESVFRCFKEMIVVLREKPNVVTVISVLSGSANGKCLRFGKQIHGFVTKLELECDVNVGTGLVDMYSKCGSWQCAYKVFQELGSNRSLVTWNSMIAGLMLNGQEETAIVLFNQLETEESLKIDSVTMNSMISGFSQLGKVDESCIFLRKMQSCGVVPNTRCITSLLAACASQYMLKYGKQLHAYARRMEIIDNEYLSTAIIDMYMKCGLPCCAQNFFNQLNVKPKDAVVWNAMISGFGRNGKSEDAFDIFNQMIEHNIKPTLATLGCLLFVCSHSGQVEKGFEILRLLTVDYGLIPTSHHFSILINLLSRSGKLDEARELLEASNETSASVFASLLGACKDYSDSNLAEEMAQRLSEIDPENPIPFVILSNIYAGQEKWKDVAKIRKLMDEKGLKKVPALSYANVA